MKVGMQKVHDNEWLIQMGPAILRLDRFTTHLFHISLKHSLCPESQDKTSILQNYVQMSLKLNFLAPLDWPNLIAHLNKDDLRIWLALIEDDHLKAMVLRQMGSVAGKQMAMDLTSVPLPDEGEQKLAMRRFLETLYRIEDEGLIEFHYPASAYL
jgi:hypothetical protein